MTTDLAVPAASADLEADPVEFMAVALNRAKGWLEQAQDIEQVRETKAIAVGYEAVIREKELAMDAELSATEIVRRCERRIGQLVRQGQNDGTIASKGQRVDLQPRARVHEVVGVSPNDRGAIADHYSLGDAPADHFDQAVNDARGEGSLSRANVIRKIKGEKPKQERSDWHRNRRHIDSDRILTALAQELDAASAGLELIEPAALNPDVIGECVPSIKRSISIINKHVRRVTNG